MTDDEIKAIVLKYIMDRFESDNADGLHEMDEWYTDDDEEFGAMPERAYELYRKARITVTFDD